MPRARWKLALESFGSGRRRRCNSPFSARQEETQNEQLRLSPAEESFAYSFLEAKIGHEAVVEFTPTRVLPAARAVHDAVFGQCAQTPVVELHHRGKKAARCALERQFEKCPFRVRINRSNEPGKIGPDIEKQGGRHQIRFAHVEVLVFVERLEPKAISRRELLVVIASQIRDILTF